MKPENKERLKQLRAYKANKDALVRAKADGSARPEELNTRENALKIEAIALLKDNPQRKKLAKIYNSIATMNAASSATSVIPQSLSSTAAKQNQGTTR